MELTFYADVFAIDDGVLQYNTMEGILQWGCRAHRMTRLVKKQRCSSFRAKALVQRRLHLNGRTSHTFQTCSTIPCTNPSTPRKSCNVHWLVYSLEDLSKTKKKTYFTKKTCIVISIFLLLFFPLFIFLFFSSILFF